MRQGDDLVVGHRVGHLVAARRIGQVDGEFDVDGERLPDLGLMRHDAVIGVQGEARDEDAVGHRALARAATTFKACTISCTSCTRRIAAPSSAAMRCVAMEPPIRSDGSDGEIELMKRLREAQTRSGRPKRLNAASRARQRMLCSGVLPKPMPGSSTILSRAMPAWAAISCEREK